MKSKSILKWLNRDTVKRDYSACFKMADWALASFLLLHQILEITENYWSHENKGNEKVKIGNNLWSTTD